MDIALSVYASKIAICATNVGLREDINVAAFLIRGKRRSKTMTYGSNSVPAVFREYHDSEPATWR